MNEIKMDCYGIEGKSVQHMGLAPPNGILMNGPRPTLNHIARPDGTWELDETLLATEIRDERDKRLKICDWRALADVTMPDSWRTYRQALRDVTSQGGFPTNVQWPTEPRD